MSSVDFVISRRWSDENGCELYRNEKISQKCCFALRNILIRDVLVAVVFVVASAPKCNKVAATRANDKKFQRKDLYTLGGNIYHPFLAGFVPPSPPLCLNALGMQNGKIKLGDIQASSQYDHRHRPDNGRLHFQRTSSRTGAWSARTNDKNQWFQVKFERAAKIRRVACQGRMDADQWVKKYTLEYSLDGKSWKDYGFNGKTTVGCQLSLSLSRGIFRNVLGCSYEIV